MECQTPVMPNQIRGVEPNVDSARERSETEIAERTQRVDGAVPRRNSANDEFLTDVMLAGLGLGGAPDR